ncbi:MAG: SEC-C metal-binding domain-containing protein [Planctomycetaceae bacterium]
MRLTEQEIMDGLLHPNVWVRDEVLRYFSNSHRTQPDVTRKVVEAVEQFGWKEAFHWPHQVADFTPDSTLLPWVLEQIDRTDADAPNENLRHHLALMIARAPVETLRPHLDRVLSHKCIRENFFPNSRLETPAEQIRQQLEIHEQSVETCWNRLREHCELIAEVESFEEADIPRCELLIDRIAAGPFDHSDEVCRLLRDTEPDVDGASGWLVGLMIILAGRLRLEQAVPLLYRHFDVDWDWYNEEISNGLIRIGTESVHRYVAKHYLDQPWDVRIFAHSVFEDIHTNTVLDDLLPLIDEEPDEELRVQLAVAAVSHFDDRGVDIAREIYAKNPTDPEREGIASRLVAFAYLADINLPERSEWEQQLNDDWKHFLKRSKAADRLLRGPGPAKKEPAFFDTEFTESAARTAATGTATIQNTSAKVGRNDPCPCGSGKKYKKCCLCR